MPAGSISRKGEFNVWSVLQGPNAAVPNAGIVVTLNYRERTPPAAGKRIAHVAYRLCGCCQRLRPTDKLRGFRVGHESSKSLDVLFAEGAQLQPLCDARDWNSCGGRGATKNFDS